MNKMLIAIGKQLITIRKTGYSDSTGDLGIGKQPLQKALPVWIFR